MLFVTTAPAPASYTRAMDPPVSSRNPEASIVGFRSRTPAISVRRSTIGRTELMEVLKALGDRKRQPNKVKHLSRPSTPGPTARHFPLFRTRFKSGQPHSDSERILKSQRV